MAARSARAAAGGQGASARQRIYLETMKRVLGGTDKTIIDTGGQSSPGVVPYLPLTSLPRERATQQQPAGGN